MTYPTRRNPAPAGSFVKEKNLKPVEMEIKAGRQPWPAADNGGLPPCGRGGEAFGRYGPGGQRLSGGS
jgi:hypothetical protein